MNIAESITQQHLDYWADYDPRPVTMNPPDGMDSCVAAPAVVRRSDDGDTVVSVPWQPNEIELAHLARGGTIWLTTWGGLPPHMLEVQEP